MSIRRNILKQGVKTDNQTNNIKNWNIEKSIHKSIQHEFYIYKTQIQIYKFCNSNEDDTVSCTKQKDNSRTENECSKFEEANVFVPLKGLRIFDFVNKYCYLSPDM